MPQPWRSERTLLISPAVPCIREAAPQSALPQNAADFFVDRVPPLTAWSLAVTLGLAMTATTATVRGQTRTILLRLSFVGCTFYCNGHYMTADTTDDIGVVASMRTLNQCQVQSLEKAGRELDPSDPNSCAVFNKQVATVQATIIYNFKLTSFRAMGKEDPAAAATLWLEMKNLCEKAMTVLRVYKDLYPLCGTSELYDLTLACWSEAEDRRQANAKDAEWMSKPIPAGLFPSQS